MKTKEWLIRQLGKIQIWKFPLFITFGSTSYKLKGIDMREIMNMVIPGDIILRRYDSYIGSRLIPGYYSHAGLYVGDGNVIHILHDGLMKDDLLDFLRTDHVAVMRHENSIIAMRAVNKANDLFDHGVVKYDFDFKNKNKKFYCSELIAYCYNYPFLFGYKATQNLDYILPDHLLSLNNFFQVFYPKTKYRRNHV